MVFSALMPSITAFADSGIIALDPSISKAEPEYTREYSFNSPEKQAENDRILYEAGAWTTKYSSSFFNADDEANSAYHDLRNTLKSNSKFQGFTSLGTPSSSWTVDTSKNYYAAIPTITQDHPRLLITKDKIPTVRKALEEHTKTNDRFFELLDTTYDEVNYFKLDTIDTIKANGGFGDDPNNPKYDDRAGLHNYRKDYLEIIQIKALGYLVDGHKLYGYQAIQGMKNFLRTLDIQYIKSNMERENGNVAFTAALVFDWCYPLLNADDKTQLMSAVQNIALKGTMPGNDENKMHCGYPPFSTDSNKVGAVAGHGSEREILRDYLAVAVAFYGEGTAANNWWTYISKLVYSQYVPVRNYYFRSGVAPQGLGVYVSGRHISDMYSAWILLTATGTQPYDNIDKTVRNFLGWETQPNFLFSDGDGNYVGKQIGEQNTYELRSLAYMTAYLFNDNAMLTQARTMPDNTSRATDPYYNGVYGADTIELTSAMYVALTGMSDMTYDSTIDKYEGMPLIQYNGSPLGQYVTHEAYGVSDSASAYMRIKEIYTTNHEHLDAGTFMIYYKGMLTADTGLYASYGGAHQRYYHTATVSHNGLLIFDSSKYNSSSENLATKWYSGGQIFKNTPSNLTDLTANCKAGNVVGNRHAYTDSTKTKPLYAYVAGDITASYDSSTVDHVGRRMLTVYTGDDKVPMLFFTYDTITSDDATYQKKFLLQIASSERPTSGTVTTNGSDYKTIKTENGDGQLVLTCINGNLTHKGMSGYRVNGVENPATGSPAPWGHIELLIPTGNYSDSLLNAMYVTDAGNTTYYASEKITNSSKGNITSGVVDLEGCVFNNSVAAVFTKNELKSSSNFVSSTMSFTAPGSGELSYYVDGLKGGNWNIKVTSNGQTYTTTSKASNGLLTFNAPAGDVVLTKEAEAVTTLKNEMIATLGTKIANDGSYTESSYSAYVEAYNAITAAINSATTTSALNAIDVAAMKAAAEAKLVVSLDTKRNELLTELGTKKANTNNAYTSASYSAYSTAYDTIVSMINNATTIDALNNINVADLKSTAEEKLVTSVDDMKATLITQLGSKLTNSDNRYTSASYSAYSTAYDIILNSIKNATTVTELNNINVTTSKTAAESKLITTVDAKKAELIAALGEKKSSAGYTAGSYAEYSAQYDAILASINSASSFAVLESINVTELKATAESELKASPEGSETTTIETPNGSASKDVYVYYEGIVSSETVYSIDVVWTDLSFAYSEGTTVWDPEKHEYVTPSEESNVGWTDSTGEITIINHSNAKVLIEIIFEEEIGSTDNIIMNISEPKFTLESAVNTTFNTAPSKTATIQATGKPSTSANIGKITVQIKKAT